MRKTRTVNPPRREIWEAMIEKAVHLRDKVLVAMLCLTGARISELLNVTIYDFEVKEELGREFCVVRLVRKKSRRGIPERKVPIPVDDPLFTLVARHLASLKNVPTIYPFYSFNNPQRPIDRVRAWRIIKKLNPDVWCHLARHYYLSEKAPDLGDYGLVQVAGWSDSRPAKDYIHLDWRSSARKMIR